jgi:hypothetical protein
MSTGKLRAGLPRLCVTRLGAPSTGTRDTALLACIHNAIISHGWFSPNCLRPGLFTMFDQEPEPTALNSPDQLSEVAS